VVGGESNQLKSASFYGAIVGGSKNQVDMSYGLVAGGKQNSAEAFGGPSSGGTHAVILGGTNNRVQNTGNLVLGGRYSYARDVCVENNLTFVSIVLCLGLTLISRSG
jgi:hypothetical protein